MLSYILLVCARRVSLGDLEEDCMVAGKRGKDHFYPIMG